jgi:hypothetical protein
MTLPQAARSDLLEFLGATPVSDRQIDCLIVQARQAQKRADVLAHGAASAQGARPAANPSSPAWTSV